MRKTLLLVLIFSGLSALSTNIFKEYHYVKSSKTWPEAQSYCREMFTDLATIDNQDDNNRLLSVIQDPGEYAWIGLYDDLSRWKWTLGNADFNSDSNFSDWRYDEPNNERSTENCSVMTINGFWRDFDCLRELPAVCFYEQGPSKYILVQAKMTWHTAYNYCRSYYTDLVSVRNISENKLIASLLSSKTWIGLHRNPWSKWSDQSPTTFTNWNKTQPDNSGDSMTSCAVVNTTTGTWWDADCEAKHYFICQKSSGVHHKTTFKLRFQSEADLNDPNIQQQILKQLHSKLERQGLPDFKLRWIQTDGQTFHKEQKKRTEQGSGG